MNARFRFPMVKVQLAGLSCLLLGLWTASAATQPTNAPARGLDFASFQIITNRNIFNPRRSARYTPPTERPASAPAAKVDYFALVGIMSYEKGPFAFFDGSAPEYRKVLKQDDTIAGFKIAEIAPAQVKLASPTNQIELAVGKQLRREEGGNWMVFDGPEPPAIARSERVTTSRRAPDPTGAPDAAQANAQPPTGETNADSAAGTGSSDLDAILQRLAERARAERGDQP